MANTELTKNNFDEEVLKSELPVLVDFWAVWCGPCRMVAPFVEQAADEFEGKLKVCKVNIDEEPELAERYRVNVIPTFILFKDGQKVDSIEGALPKSTINKFIEANI